jgi:hypothetical protein
VSEYRWEAQPRVDRGVTRWNASGLPVQLVTIGLLPEASSDERSEPLKRTPVLWDLHPREARELALRLLELAELAERRSQEPRW